MKSLRGTPLDIFGYTADRKLERKLIRQYEQDIRMLMNSLNKTNHLDAITLAGLPQDIRGYGPLKKRTHKKLKSNGSSSGQIKFRQYW